MTVVDLIRQLEPLPPDMTVVLSCDGEGNGYGNLGDVDVSPLNSCGEPCHEDDAEPDAQRVVVLWPVE